MPSILRLVVFCVCIVLIPSASAKRLFAQTQPPPLYVSPTGVDTNPGTQAQPLKTVAEAVRRLQNYGIVYLAPGTYPIAQTQTITKTWVTITASSPLTAILENTGFAGSIFSVQAEGVTISGLKLDGKFASGSRAIQGSSKSPHFTLRNCEIKQFTRHAVDVDGADTLIDSAHIHHILWWDDAQGGRLDAHGVVSTNGVRLRLRNCNIHHVSGDCFQAERGNWQDIVLDGCHLYDAPLEAAYAGFAKGVRATENAVDTKKVATVERGRIAIKNSKIYGFRSTLIGLPAALNLKENVDVVVDSCEIYDSKVALRLRGPGDRGECWPAIVNCVVRDSDIAVRYEDGLKNLRVAFNTFHNCPRWFARVPSSSPWGTGFVIADNLFTSGTTLPQEAPGPTNKIAPAGSINTTTLRPVTSNGLLGQPVTGVLPVWYGQGTGVTFDKDRRRRSTTTPTVGAYEYVP